MKWKSLDVSSKRLQFSWQILNSAVPIFGTKSAHFDLDPRLFLQPISSSSTLSSPPLSGSSGVSWNVCLRPPPLPPLLLFSSRSHFLYKYCASVYRRRPLGVIYNLVLRHSATRWSRPLHGCHDVTLSHNIWSLLI